MALSGTPFARPRSSNVPSAHEASQRRDPGHPGARRAAAGKPGLGLGCRTAVGQTASFKPKGPSMYPYTPMAHKGLCRKIF